MHDESKKNGYGDTLNLPKTDFPLRANFKEVDQQMLDRWAQEKLSQKTFDCHKGEEKFILHDGPPYSNGNIHLGHAYNKILKDIITKAERMLGKHVPVIPGWDCHGLPIELKVTQEQPGLSREDLKIACRAYAQKWIDIQREEFKKLGIMMHWDQPYTTMSTSYESSIVRAFGKFYQQGFIEKKLKTVPWCPSCQTVLANAEIEYAERKDPSIYVQFPMSSTDVTELFPKITEGTQVSLLIWTTTPWTLPLNRAVILKPGAKYSVIKINEKYVVLGHDLVAKLSATMGVQAEVIATIDAEFLIGRQVYHPFVVETMVPIIGDDFVSLEDGTACVHSAPGCGPEDYEIALKNNLEIYSPLTADGKYSSEIRPYQLGGMSVTDGQIWVIKKLAEENKLLFKASIRHSYPHCWRCRNGLIFRATSQWFCNLAQNRLKDRALEAIETLKMYPETGRNRFSATLEGRLEWCLSRQRTWGVPIPAVHCTKCAHVFTNLELIETAARGIEKEGIEFWDRVSVEDLGNFSCPKCQNVHVGKEYDILDVWFESGVSHYAVLYNNPTQAFPASMYLEGKDQHRAWFQSSLLTGLVLEGQAPMREILTHGFTVDEQGKKMSKSVGNVITPQQIIEQVGTDGLRLWVASSDCGSDPIYSAALLKNISEVYRKVRNTSRFLLSNLYDFDYDTDSVSVEKMFPIDQYALIKLHEFNQTMQNAYKERNVTAAFHAMADYCSKDLSSFYLDIVKDRLYVEHADGIARRSAQTVVHEILNVLTTTIAPILSFTSEQIFDHYKKEGDDSIHLQTFVKTDGFDDAIKNLYSSYQNVVQSAAENYIGGVVRPSSTLFYHFAWNHLISIRTCVLKALELAREQGDIGHSLDASVELYAIPEFLNSDMRQMISKSGHQDIASFIKELCIVSGVVVHDSVNSELSEVVPGIFVKISKAQGVKCPRCWQWTVCKSQDGLCGRCEGVLKK
jgi:isoleucyl-tRNA synthetase